LSHYEVNREQSQTGHESGADRLGWGIASGVIHAHLSSGRAGQYSLPDQRRAGASRDGSIKKRKGVMGKQARIGLLLGASACLLAVMVDWVIEELNS
jgi:hypothetical protein